MRKHLAAVGLESIEERRRAYREILFTTEGIGQFISGVILFDETIRQRASDGSAFLEVLRDRGVIPGIKVDKGTSPLAGFPGELGHRGPRWAQRQAGPSTPRWGARFVKWRAVVSIGEERPSSTGIEANAHVLARYAALSQEAGLVPVVEPEVIMDGPHSLERHGEVTAATLRALYEHLARHRVVLEASLLKPNMVLSGTEHAVQASLDEVAEATIGVLRQAVPAAVPGIVFLSGGQSDEEATARLDAINRRAPQPWELSFSFGRALQAPVLRVWAGEEANRRAAQAALVHRAAMNGAARHGQYRPDMEQLSTSPT
jgi:fructose-bisphosphate aldolase class I